MNEFVISPELYKAIGDELKKSLIQEMRRTKTIASGNLLNSIKFDISKTGDGNAIISIEANEYIVYVDKGRKPGKYAPLKALEAWVKQKGIATDKKKVTAIAFAINNKIKKQGIKPKPILEKAYSNGLPMYNKIIDEVMNKDLDKYLNEALNNI
jgi:hypothetical protein